MNALKNFILKFEFIQDIIDEEIGDRLQMSQEVIQAKAQQLATKDVSELLGTVDEREIITMDEQKGIIFLGGQRIETTQALSMRQEAELIESTYLWKTMSATIESSAQKRIFEKSLTYEDMMAGKMALYNLSLYRKMIKIFKNYVAK